MAEWLLKSFSKHVTNMRLTEGWVDQEDKRLLPEKKKTERHYLAFPATRKAKRSVTAFLVAKPRLTALPIIAKPNVDCIGIFFTCTKVMGNHSKLYFSLLETSGKLPFHFHC